MKIISIAPTRIGLLGGGTDVFPFSKKHGAEILNFAINLRHTCELLPRDDDWVWIEAMGESRIHKLHQLPQRKVDPKFDLIYEAIRSYVCPSGFQLIDKFNGIQGSGLGSSASAAVSMIGAFNKWLGIKETRLDMARKAQQLELSLGWISGYQDQIAAVYGGLNYFKGGYFPSNVRNIRFIPEFWNECFVMIFTGSTRHSGEMQKKLVKSMNTKKGTEALKKSKTQVKIGLSMLKDGEVRNFGELLNEAWELKKQSNPETSNDKIDQIYDFAMKNGAIGGKILGAGGEGHMLFVCEPEDREALITRLEGFGVKWVDFSIDWTGLEVRTI
jgi:D-glycero-alpha-D-manno-heptose-7-phosphate kinase